MTDTTAPGAKVTLPTFPEALFLILPTRVSWQNGSLATRTPTVISLLTLPTTCFIVISVLGQEHTTANTRDHFIAAPALPTIDTRDDTSPQRDLLRNTAISNPLIHRTTNPTISTPVQRTIGRRDYPLAAIARFAKAEAAAPTFTR
jgi:hypothetical protein